MAHTKGKCERCNGLGRMTAKEPAKPCNNSDVITCICGECGGTGLTKIAYARLIAAAPELLEALRLLLEDVEYAQPQIVSGLIGNRQIRKAKDAIAKAQK
jgi:hypothetical protein